MIKFSAASNVLWAFYYKKHPFFSVEINYQPAYYVSDGFIFVSCAIILIFLEIQVEKNNGNLLDAFRRILNPASGVYFLICFGIGLGFGVFGNYGAVYLQEEMSASSAMVGMFLCY